MARLQAPEPLLGRFETVLRDTHCKRNIKRDYLNQSPMNRDIRFVQVNANASEFGLNHEVHNGLAPTPADGDSRPETSLCTAVADKPQISAAFRTRKPSDDIIRSASLRRSVLVGDTGSLKTRCIRSRKEFVEDTGRFPTSPESESTFVRKSMQNRCDVRIKNSRRRHL